MTTTTGPALPMLNGLPWDMALGTSPAAADMAPAPLWVAMTKRAHDAGIYQPLCEPTSAAVAAFTNFERQEAARAEGFELEPLGIYPARA